jgi:hypothetical protein
MIKKRVVIFIGMVFLASTASVNAEVFARVGKVLRTLSSSTSYGGCMVYLSTPIGGSCPNNGWVALDCKGTYSTEGTADRNYASAVVAASLGKPVMVHIDTTKKHSTYCVATRLDILFD